MLVNIVNYNAVARSIDRLEEILQIALQPKELKKRNQLMRISFLAEINIKRIPDNFIGSVKNTKYRSFYR